MLLDTKIQSLIYSKNSYMEDRLSVFNNELRIKGTAQTKNGIMMYILYHLLEQGFDLPYLDRELYKNLNHLLGITEGSTYTNSLTPVTTPATPSLSASATDLDYGNIVVNAESVLSFTFSIANLTAPLVLEVVTLPQHYSISFNPTEEFTNKIVLLPKNGTTNISTVYVKFKPTSLGLKTGNLTLTNSEVSPEVINLTGTGVAP